MKRYRLRERFVNAAEGIKYWQMFLTRDQMHCNYEAWLYPGSGARRRIRRTCRMVTYEVTPQQVSASLRPVTIFFGSSLKPILIECVPEVIKAMKLHKRLLK